MVPGWPGHDVLDDAGAAWRLGDGAQPPAGEAAEEFAVVVAAQVQGNPPVGVIGDHDVGRAGPGVRRPGTEGLVPGSGGRGPPG